MSPDYSEAEIVSLMAAARAFPTGLRAATFETLIGLEHRYLGAQYCPDCQTFCRRVGPGGLCPQCDEPVAYVDLTCPA